MPYADKNKRREYLNEYKKRKRKERGLQKQGRKPLSPEEKAISLIKNKEYQKLWKREYNKTNVEKRLLWAAKKRAKEKGLDFNLEESDIVVPTHCPILGIKLANTRPRGDSRRDIASLDRVDPTKGYIKGNIEVVSWLANTMKQNATPELLVAFSKEMLKRYERSDS